MFYKKKLYIIIKIITSFLLIFFLLNNCNKNKIPISTAINAIENKDYDKALKYFQKILPDEEENPVVLYNLGMLLSLKKVSIYMAIDLLKKALKINPNDETRKQLAYIYINMGQLENLEKMLKPENLKIDEAYNTQINQLRNLTECLQKPTPQKLKKLSEPQFSNLPEGKLYYFLCEVTFSKNIKDDLKLVNSFYRIADEKLKCESLDLWLSLSKNPPTDFIQKTKLECLQRFPKNLILYREILKNKIPDESIKDEKEKTTIFEVEPFNPSDPGPEIPRPVRKIYKEEEVLELEKEESNNEQ